MGLGLSITRQLVEMMDGSISVESSVGRGSVFSFSLRMEKESVQKETLSSAPGDSPQLSSQAFAHRLRVVPHILVAEDNNVNQEVCMAMLEHLGCRCDIVENGAEAVRAVERTSYDLVFMDYEMPEMDGVEATRIIREREVGSVRRTTIVALTGHAMQGYREQCIDTGMDDFLAKPFTMESIQEMLEYWLSAERVSPEHDPNRLGADDSLGDRYRPVSNAIWLNT